MIQNDRVGIFVVAFSLCVSLVIMLAPWPEPIAMARPALYPATLLFWVLMQPLRYGVIFAWAGGLLIDVLFGTPLAEHGLALAIAAYVVIRLRAVLWTLAPLQQTFLMVPIFICYEFTLFWIDGVTGASVDQSWRWLPVVTTTVIWPLWTAALEQVALFEVR